MTGVASILKYYLNFFRSRFWLLMLFDIICFGILLGFILLIKSFFSKNITLIIFQSVIFSLIIVFGYSVWKIKFFQIMNKGKLTEAFPNFSSVVILNFCFLLFAILGYFLGISLLFGTNNLIGKIFLSFLFIIIFLYLYLFLNISQLYIIKKGLNSIREAFTFFNKNFKNLSVIVLLDVVLFFVFYYFIGMANQLVYYFAGEEYLQYTYIIKILIGIFTYLIFMIDKVYIRKISEA